MNENNIIEVVIEKLDDIYNLISLDEKNTYVLNIKFKELLNDLTPICKLFNYLNSLRIMNKSFPFGRFFIVFNASSYETFSRLERLLFAQAIINKNIFIKLPRKVVESIKFSNNYEKIKINDNKQSDFVYYQLEGKKAGSFGNIQPLFSVCGNDANRFLKNDINIIDLTNVNRSIDENEFDDIINKSHINIKEKRSKLINEEEYQKEIENEISTRDKHIKIFSSDTFKSLVSNRQNISENNDTQISDKQTRFLKVVTKHNLIKFLSSIKGTHENSINEQCKKELVNDFSKKYKKIFVQMSILTQYIWSNILMNINADKQGINVVINNKEFDYSIIDKSLYDAVAYSEGVYQLIENSIIHTRFKNVNFLIRNHNVRIKNTKGKQLSENILIENLNKRKEFKERFFSHTNDYCIDEKTYNCLELVICDSAIISTKGNCAGMVNTFQKKHPEVNTVKDIFQNILKGTDVSKHYGIQLFEKNIILNHGIFKLNTPNTINDNIYCEEYISFYNYKKKEPEIRNSIEQTSNKTTRFTCYNILLPINYKWDEIQDKMFNPIGQNNRWYYEDKALSQYPKYDIEIKENIDEIIEKTIKEFKENHINLETEGKNSIVDGIHNYISDYSHSPEKLLYCDAKSLNYQSIELLAKAMFKLAYKRREDEQNLISVVFKDEYQINEFVRFFSIFYDRKGDINDLDNLQIALFLENETTDNIPIVALIIAGGNIENVYNTALMYSYSNSNISVRFVDSCRYMVRVISPNENKAKGKYVKIFPFDLFLPNMKESYFLKRLKYDIEKNDIRTYDYGCLIDNIHIRIGSKIHLKKFFEAELIFHNSNTINKFAYLIAIDIEEQCRNNAVIDANSIMLVGYEAYSSLLIQEIVRLLRAHNPNKNINYCIYSVDDKGRETVNYSPEVMKSKEIRTLLLDSLYFTVMPINTTFTTVYKMQNIIKRNVVSNFDFIERIIKKSNNYKSLDCKMDSELNTVPIDFLGHYSLIVVSQKSADNTHSIQDKYWQYDEYNNNNSNCPLNIILEKEKATQNTDGTVMVKAYIELKTEWFNPLKRSQDLENTEVGYPSEPLIYVDKTSTIPKAIFKLKNIYLDGPSSYFECKSNYNNTFNNDNLERINGLFDCITYGHIYKKDNHFLYYVNKNKYCENEKERIIDWLNNNSVKNGDFNVVISPLHNPDSIFLKLVLDYGFSHNFRLIHMPIYETNRNEVLSKFSYIAKQYEEIKRHNSSAKLNFYFVDNSIITGKTIERSLSLIRSLIAECGINEIIPSKFTKIFTLINRSRPYTIASYVEDPVKDLNSYLYLHIPNFNTHNNSCPTCALVKQYEQLIKCSSTNIMSNEYSRLASKHTVKSISEYEDWLENNILYSNGYYKWLKQWLYKYVNYFKNGNSPIFVSKEDKKEVIELYKIILKREKSLYTHCCNDIIKENDTLTEDKRISDDLIIEKSMIKYNDIDSVSLSDYSENIQKVGIYIFKKYVQGDKNFIRLKTTHEIFNELNEPDDIKECEKRILNIMCDKISKESWIYAMEYLISYIKIISRPMLSQFYHIKCAIMYIIENLLCIILRSSGTDVHDVPLIHETNNAQMYYDLVNFIENGANQEGKGKEEIIMHVVQYQLGLCLARRLTDLQSLYFLNDKNIKALYQKWGNLRKDYYKYCSSNRTDYLYMNSFPSESVVLFNISKIIKWSSMSSDENAGNFLIQDLNITDLNVNNINRGI